MKTSRTISKCVIHNIFKTCNQQEFLWHGKFLILRYQSQADKCATTPNTYSSVWSYQLHPVRVHHQGEVCFAAKSHVSLWNKYCLLPPFLIHASKYQFFSCVTLLLKIRGIGQQSFQTSPLAPGNSSTFYSTSVSFPRHEDDLCFTL